MSNLTINERFTIDADADLVWGYLIDPERIVLCLPGAELSDQEDERTYSGAVKVKVGAVTMGYKGKVVFEEVDHDKRFVRIVGRGREKTGSGTATMTMESWVEATDSGGAEVTVEAQMKLAGKIVRFGRGMIETVSSEIFREFTERLADVIAKEISEAQGATTGRVEAEAASPGHTERPVTTPGPYGSSDGGNDTGNDAGNEVGHDTGNGADSEADHDTGNGTSNGAGDVSGNEVESASPTPEDNSIALLPLLFRSLKRRMRRVFGKD